jgi:hypothetical protein
MASLHCSVAACGLPCRCIFTAADYVHGFVHVVFFDHVSDIVIDYVSARAYVRMVFITLFGFFAVLFELRRRVIRIIRHCARSSEYTSSLRPVPPRGQCHHPFYSDNRGLHQHLLLTILRL